MTRREVVIIGGGLAGSAAAARLARQGRDVLLLEKAAGPHHKVCGEFISAEACRDLGELGVDLAALGAAPVDWLRLTGGRQSLTVPLPFQAASLSRFRLDQAMLDLAKGAGAEIRCAAAVTSLAPAKDGWHIICRGEDITARAVFLATGKHDLRGWSERSVPNSDYIGFKMHFRLSPAAQAALSRRVEIMLYPGGYAGLETVEDSTANVCLVIGAARFAACGKNWDALLRHLTETVPVLARFLADAAPCWDKPLAIFNIPYGFVYQPEAAAPSGLFRLGDQMAVIPSMFGNGMAIALHTGLLAADTYLAADAEAYHRRAYGLLRQQIRFAALMSKLLTNSLLQPVALNLAARSPRLTQFVIQKTRVAR